MQKKYIKFTAHLQAAACGVTLSLPAAFRRKPKLRAAVRAVEHGILPQTAERKRGGGFVFAAARAGERERANGIHEYDDPERYNRRQGAPECGSPRRLRKDQDEDRRKAQDEDRPQDVDPLVIQHAYLPRVIFVICVI